MKRSLAILLILADPFYGAGAYTVKKGDTLSQIAYRVTKKYPYGPRGPLKRLTATNRFIKNPDYILPGWKIDLSALPLLPGVEPTLAKEAGNSPPIATSALSKNQDGELEKGERVFIRSDKEALQPTAEERRSRELAAENEAKNEKSSQDEVGASEVYNNGPVSLGPLFFYSRFDVVDRQTQGNATLLSQMNYGMNFEWRQDWSPNVQSSFSVKLAEVSVVADSTKILSHGSQSVSQIDAGVSWLPTRPLRFSLRGGMGQHLFVRATSLTELTLDNVAMPEIAVLCEYQILKINRLSLALGAGAQYFLPTSTDLFQIQGAFSYLSSITVIQQLSQRFSARGTLWYQGTQFTTSITKQNQWDLGSQFILTMDF